ncbi:MAG: succinate--CoA ligase subunit alpha [Candidatus Bathyarchaeia archaeon]
MAILVGKDTKTVVQGITGAQGRFHTQLMVEYGSNIVAGVTPGRGGTSVQGIPVFDTVEEAKQHSTVDASIIFVPAPFAKDAALEAIASDLNPVVLITEGIPLKDEIQVMEIAKQKGTTVIGPNTPGIITPTECKLGIMPGHIFKPGKIGLVSRSGTLTYEIAASLTTSGLGQSTCLGIGGDPIVGLSFVDVLEMFRQDHNTTAIAMIGEIGGNAEEQASEYVKAHVRKPVIGFVAGQTAPPGRRMGHAGAIISGGQGTAKDKYAAMSAAGIRTVQSPAEIGSTVAAVL